MTRSSLSATHQAEVVKVAVRKEYFCSIVLPSVTLRGNTGDRDIIFGGNTYLGNAKFGGFDKISETPDLKSRGVAITLSGVDNTLIAAAIADKYHYAPISLYVGFFDEAGALIADPHQIGVSLLASDITLAVAQGQMTLAAETLEVMNKRNAAVLASPETQKRRYAGDTGMDNCAAIATLEFEWGGTRYTRVVGGQVSTTQYTGGGCPAPWVPIMLDSGREIAAGRLTVGASVIAWDEASLEPGVHQVTALATLAGVQLMMLTTTDGRRVEASFDHPFYVTRQPTDPDDDPTGAWVQLKEIMPGDRIAGVIPGVVCTVVPTVVGDCVRITIDGAHSFMAAGLLSHNKQTLNVDGV